MRVARFVRGALVLVAAGILARAARRQGVDFGRLMLTPGRAAAPADPVVEIDAEILTEDEPEVEEQALAEESLSEQPVVEQPGAEYPAADAPVEAADELTQKLPAYPPAPPEPPASVTDIVDDLLAPQRDRDAPIEDATVVEDPPDGAPEPEKGP